MNAEQKGNRLPNAILRLLTLSSLVACQGFAATITVTNTNDSGSGSLRDAIATALSGDTINFSLPNYPATLILSSVLSINNSLTINGPGASNLAISGNGAVQVINVPIGITVEISGVTIENGFAGSGGGISNAGTLTLLNSTVSNNFGGFGGGIFNTGALNIAGSTVSRNEGVDDGGGIRNNGTLSLTNSTVSGNDAQAGGGIENAGTLTLTNSRILNNLATAGAGIDHSSTAVLTISNSTFSGNAAESEGGAIAAGGTVTLTGSTFSNNSGRSGGAIWGGGTLTVINSTLSGNAVGPGAGGAISFSGTSTLINSTLSGNSSAFNGGAIAVSGSATLTNTTLSGNAGGVFGGSGAGAIWISNGTATLKNTIVANSPSGGNCLATSGGSFSSEGHNLSDDNSCSGFLNPAIGDLNNTPAGLDPSGLQNNGGSTQTIALLPTSPAVDAIHVSPSNDCTAIDGVTPISTDQRGVPRPQGLACDIGGYELRQPIPSTTISTTSSGLAYSRVTQTFNGTITLTNISNAAISGPLEVVLTALPAGVTLVNATGTFAGNPYITVPLSAGSLAPGQAATVAVRFKDPSNVTITATPLVYSGSLD